MHNLALKEAQRHVLFHHSGADGWITIAQKDNGRFRQYHYKPEELADHLTEWTGENVYFSQNTFYKPARRIDTIRQLRSLYVDIDVHTKGLKPEWVLGKLELEAFGQTIPDPNMVIFSGRGLVLIWNIDPVPFQAMPLWKAVESYFIDQLAEVGADPKASDPARIFRIAGSINSKSGTVVKVEYRHNYRYDIHEIQFDYLPELEPSKQKKPGRKSKIVRLFNTYTLHLSRAKDIAKLVELREGDVGDCRENICFLYRYYTCCYTDDPQQALEDTLSLNTEFTRPLPENEVIRATKSAERAWKAKSCKKANEIAKAKGYPGAGYNIKNTAIIEWLLITPEEQQYMSTIIDSKEKRRRKLAYEENKRREAGMRAMEDYNSDRKKVVQSKADNIRQALQENPQLTIRQLQERTGIPRSTIARIRKTL